MGRPRIAATSSCGPLDAPASAAPSSRAAGPGRGAGAAPPRGASANLAGYLPRAIELTGVSSERPKGFGGVVFRDPVTESDIAAAWMSEKPTHFGGGGEPYPYEPSTDAVAKGAGQR